MIKRNFRLKVLAVFMVLSMIYEISYPTLAWALSGGPSQPEVQSFEPVGTTEMVDLFTGDFNYNIPLMDVGGYPINIAYHSGITMDQEATWVGLGWNINPGVINRNMRGLPDDFKNEDIKKEFSRKPNLTFGADLALNALKLELFGVELGKISYGFGINYNNYKGVNYTMRATPSMGVLGGSGGISMGLAYSSDGGFDASPNINFSASNYDATNKAQSGNGGGFNVGASFNSRSGMKSLNYGISGSVKHQNNAAIDKGISSSHNFNTQTWVPTGNIPSRSLSIVRSIAMGADYFGSFPEFKFTGSLAINMLKDKEVTKRGFGYLYEEQGYKDYDASSFKNKTLAFISERRSEQKASEESNDVLLDFNREKDNSYSKNSTNLPLTNHTYDAYAVSGQGISGSYRFHRSDFGIVHDDFSHSNSGNSSTGAEIGVGNLAHNGGNMAFVYNTTKTGMWVEKNSYKDYINFVGNQEVEDPLYEPAYLKAAGEMLPVDKAHFDKIYNYKTIKPDILNGYAKNSFYVKEGIVKSPTLTVHNQTIKLRADKNVRTKRDPRNQLMTYLTAEEAQIFGLETNIKSVPQNATHNGIEFSNTSISRVGSESETRRAHHLSEINVTKDDGSRYVYGIPAYNNTQVEKTFNVNSGENPVFRPLGMIPYNNTTNILGQIVSTDNTIRNTQGEDKFYSSTTLPGYAHSYLLTGILSPDYVDIREDGITEDDLGTAVKFNYTRTHGAYKWRVPYTEEHANYVEGLQHTTKDDKGAYTYGEKEIWLMHSIETKTHIALFMTSDREDAMPVKGEDGGKADNFTTNKLKKLDKIILYSKVDYLKNPQTAVPIKVVHFVYDYSLCPDIENNSGANVEGNSAHGKLTLKEIYFTYGKSNRGRTTPYKFTYSATNPSYNLKGYDRWGSYKPNEETLPNTIYPYTPQVKSTADVYANAWSMTEVFLPSGGKIKVEYEADDYAYVQDRQAMQMLKIAGFGKYSEKNIEGPITYSKLVQDGIGKNHYDLLFFNLARPILGSNPDDTIKQKYLNGLKNIQFTVYADINGKGAKEFVKGYAEIDWEKGGGGVSLNGQYGWVALKMVDMGDKFLKGLKTKPISPVSKSIWNYAKLNTPDLTFPYSEGEGSQAKMAALRLISIIPEFIKMIQGFNSNLETQNFGREIITDKSFVRLNSPYKIKFGGGHRVKRIVTNDNWTQMGSSNTDPQTSEYGTEYSYLKEEKQANGEILNISSGVASYEPNVGSDENPFIQPRPIVQKNLCVPNETYLQEEPFGESFFPAANVGYSVVTVKSISKQGEKRNGAGYKVNEFYTDFDFPTIVNETEITRELVEPEPLWSLFEYKKETSAKVSQGYTIELNDMAGKAKSEFTYAEGSKNPISGARYVYKTSKEIKPQRLNNKIPTISKTGQIIEEEVGVEYDFVTDMRESRNKNWNAGISLNIETFIVGFVPITVPIILPSYSEDFNQFNSAVSTKVIKRYGILTETIAYQEGASISSKNLLWDRETGQVLLSSTQNEFEDNIYSYNQPAHWAYEGMGHAYKNCDLTFEDVTISSSGTGAIVLPNSLNAANYFIPGDECMAILEGQYQRVWVYNGTDNILNLIDEDGYPFVTSSSFKLKILRSGRKNMPTASIGSITTLKNPLSVSGGNYSL